MSTPAPARKSAKDYCFCTHTPSDHSEEKGCGLCPCAHYLRRPCTCSHHFDAHRGYKGRCHEKGCDCKFFKQDDSPEQMLRNGIRAGDWQFMTIPQLKSLQRPGVDPDIRIYVTGLLHTQGRRRLAMRMNKNKVLVNLQPYDIMRELNELDTVPRLDRHAVRKSIRKLEREGRARQGGTTRKNIRLFFYMRPLPSRQLKTNPIFDEDLGVYPDPQIFPSPTKEEYLREALILPVRKVIVKIFSRELRKELEGMPDLGVDVDPEKIIDQATEEVLLGVQNAYQKVLLGVRNGGYYMEASSPLSSPTTTPVDAPAEQQPSEDLLLLGKHPASPEQPAPDPVGEVMEGICGEVEPVAVARLIKRCLAKDASLTHGEIADFVTKKGKYAKGKDNPPGFLIDTVPLLIDAKTVAELRKKRSAPKPRMSSEELRAEQEAVLKNPKASELEKETARTILEAL